ncbi:MmgE/PrpD family protein [Rhizobium sp. CF080]|nr:MmgE/PrpD family protein [Rhizobium sp. CF080]
MNVVTGQKARQMGKERKPLRILSEWAAGACNFSPLAYRRGEDAFSDITACMIAGMNDVSTRSVVDAVAEGGLGQCLAFGASGRVSAPWAALINGTAAHALDFDDNFAPAFTHATAVLALSLIHI